jgi:hypothetical protein
MWSSTTREIKSVAALQPCFGAVAVEKPTGLGRIRGKLFSTTSSAAKNALRVCRVWERSLSSWTELAYAAAELAYLSISSSTA